MILNITSHEKNQKRNCPNRENINNNVGSQALSKYTINLYFFDIYTVILNLPFCWEGAEEIRS